MIYLLRKSNQNNKQIVNNALEEAKELLNSGDVSLNIEVYKSTRSKQQNAYFWKLATLLGDFLGYDKEDIKDYFMTELGYFKETEKNGKNYLIPHSTTRLKVDEFSVLIECVIDKLVENKIQYPQPQYYGYEID